MKDWFGHPKNLKGNLIALGILVLFPAFLVTCEWRNRVQNKVECRHFLDQIRLGDTRSEVRGKFEAGSYRQLNLQAYSSGKADMIISKNQIGAKNWHIYVFFEDSRVVAVKVRTGDGIKDHPADAPPDLGKYDGSEFDQWKD